MIGSMLAEGETPGYDVHHGVSSGADGTSDADLLTRFGGRVASWFAGSFRARSHELAATRRVRADEMQGETDEASSGTIDVEFGPGGFDGSAAIVRLGGEHDSATVRELAAVLEPISGSVLIDLSACSIVDPSVIALLVENHQTREAEGHRLELVVPPTNQAIVRTFAIIGISKLLVVHPDLPTA
jgi:anti-anti-sigma regulatory factor